MIWLLLLVLPLFGCLGPNSLDVSGQPGTTVSQYSPPPSMRPSTPTQGGTDIGGGAEDIVEGASWFSGDEEEEILFCSEVSDDFEVPLPKVVKVIQAALNNWSNYVHSRVYLGTLQTPLPYRYRWEPLCDSVHAKLYFGRKPENIDDYLKRFNNPTAVTRRQSLAENPKFKGFAWIDNPAANGPDFHREGVLQALVTHEIGHMILGGDRHFKRTVMSANIMSLLKILKPDVLKRIDFTRELIHNFHGVARYHASSLQVKTEELNEILGTHFEGAVNALLIRYPQPLSLRYFSPAMLSLRDFAPPEHEIILSDSRHQISIRPESELRAYSEVFLSPGVINIASSGNPPEWVGRDALPVYHEVLFIEGRKIHATIEYGTSEVSTDSSHLVTLNLKLGPKLQTIAKFK